MPPIYDIKADFIDIRRDNPQRADRLLVDTNVWYYRVYSGAASPARGSPPPQMPNYLAYLHKAEAIPATVLWHLGLSLAELTHIIEEAERVHYCDAVQEVDTKEYRHNMPTERARVTTLIDTAWTEVEAISTELQLSINAARVNAARARSATEPLDGYDLFFREAMVINGVTQILTDDGGFACVAGIEVFTANVRVLAAARAKKRLVVR